jgi:hypothetical protein
LKTPKSLQVTLNALIFAFTNRGVYWLALYKNRISKNRKKTGTTQLWVVVVLFICGK